MTASKFAAAADFASNSHSRRLSATLRRTAWEAGWPASAARHLWVRHQDGEYQVHYPSHAADHIENHEYGSEGKPPLPAIRQFMARIHGDDHHLDQALHHHALNMGVLD